MRGCHARRRGYTGDLKCSLCLHEVHGPVGRQANKSVLTEESSELEEGPSALWRRVRRGRRAASCRSETHADEAEASAGLSLLLNRPPFTHPPLSLRGHV